MYLHHPSADSRGLQEKGLTERMPSFSMSAVTVMDHDDAGQQSLRGLSAIESCPECNEYTLSEIVLCKGTNIAAHKGRWYQVVSVSQSIWMVVYSHPFVSV